MSGRGMMSTTFVEVWTIWLPMMVDVFALKPYGVPTVPRAPFSCATSMCLAAYWPRVFSPATPRPPAAFRSESADSASAMSWFTSASSPLMFLASSMVVAASNAFSSSAFFSLRFI